MKPKPRIDVHIGADAGVQPGWIRSIAERVLRGESFRGSGALSVVLVDDIEIRRLNAEFLKRDRPTDVIAFPYAGDEDGLWGEVYVSVDRAREQAGEFGIALEEELARLVIHGVLHLTGYDDGDAGSRERMRLRENRYLEHGD